MNNGKSGTSFLVSDQVFKDRKDLRLKIMNCEICDLGKCDNHGPVPFRGRPGSTMILGEAPGKVEDRQGKPFIGPAGLLLWDELHKVGIDEDQVFIANSVCCWPNREDKRPTEAEMYACRGFLYEQIKYCDPVVILALGATANITLGRTQSLGQIRGEWYTFPWFRSSEGIEIEVLPTWHPSFLLRNRSHMREWRHDLKEFADGGSL